MQSRTEYERLRPRREIVSCRYSTVRAGSAGISPIGGGKHTLRKNKHERSRSGREVTNDIRLEGTAVDDVTQDCGAFGEAVAFPNHFKNMPDPRQRGDSLGQLQRSFVVWPALYGGRCKPTAPGFPLSCETWYGMRNRKTESAARGSADGRHHETGIGRCRNDAQAEEACNW
jgi:hypothetical protein